MVLNAAVVNSVMAKGASYCTLSHRVCQSVVRMRHQHGHGFGYSGLLHRLLRTQAGKILRRRSGWQMELRDGRWAIWIGDKVRR